MEPQTGTCFLTGEECIVTEVHYEDKQYLIKEDLADDHSLKQLRGMISQKIEDETAKKAVALEQLKTAAEALGVDPEAFEALLIGKGKPAAQPSAPAPVLKSKQLAPPKKDPEEDFREVEGDLKSTIRQNVVAGEGVSAAMPAYNKVEDEEGHKVVEENKKIKKVDENTVITKGSLGTTVVKIDHRSGREIDQMLRQVDDETGELMRAAVSGGGGKASGTRTIECPLCRGSGITRTGAKTCPKCGGSGFVTA